MVSYICHKCGSKIDEGWDYCPRCGTPAIRPVRYGGEKKEISSFDEMLHSFKKHMDEMDKMMSMDLHDLEKDFEVFDVKPSKRPGMKRNGFSISIESGTGKKPKVDVKTFGDIDKEKLSRIISGRFGIDAHDVEQQRTSEEKAPKEQVKGPEEPIEKMKDRPKITEEPKTDIKRLPEKVIIETNLPGVESEDDIIIHVMKDSIELRAFSKNKMYFKIIQIPRGWTMSGKTLKDGVFTIELNP